MTIRPLALLAMMVYTTNVTYVTLHLSIDFRCNISRRLREFLLLASPQGGLALKPEAPKPFNPLDKIRLAESVARVLLASRQSPLPPKAPFIGAGVYAIYYRGGFEPYQPLVRAHRPVYVGKAIPPGARKGGFSLGERPGQVLYNRLHEHAETIEQTRNLKPSDFRCQYLVTEDIWIPLAESLLIEKLGPVWNKVVDGFGNHDPGKGRYNQQRSPWDVLHPGRLWAERCRPCNKSQEEILRAVKAHMKPLD